MAVGESESTKFFEWATGVLGSIVVGLGVYVWSFLVTRDQVMEMIQQAKPTRQEIFEMIATAIAAYEEANTRLDISRAETVAADIRGIKDQISDFKRNSGDGLKIIMDAIKETKDDMRDLRRNLLETSK